MMSEMLAANQPVMVDDTNIINVWKDNLEQAFKDIAEIVQTVCACPVMSPAAHSNLILLRIYFPTPRIFLLTGGDSLFFWMRFSCTEVAAIRMLLTYSHTHAQHPYVAMDTEFPGVVARPYGTFRSHTDYQYQTLKCNVDLLRIIQLGLTFSDENGNLHERCTWQFHFTFNLESDIFAQDSIDLLRKAGVFGMCWEGCVGCFWEGGDGALETCARTLGASIYIDTPSHSHTYTHTACTCTCTCICIPHARSHPHEHT